jgi:site-specific recombinase XerD
VTEVLGLVRSLAHRSILSSCYAAGLRISEACAMRVEDIDAKRMLLRVPKAKSRARYVMLSERLLALLRAHWRRTRPSGPYLFPGGPGRDFVSRKQPAKSLRAAVRASGIGKRVCTHTLRHSFATHLIDLGTDIRTVQMLLGHASVSSTSHYTKLSRAHLSERSPFDLLGTPAAEPLG